MIPSAAVELSGVESPINAPVTKFGGEPFWLEKPQWPLSRKFGFPMMFIGQIAFADVPSLPEGLRTSGRLAYLFMSAYAEGGLPIWESEGGENAVIVQPRGGNAVVSTVEEPDENDLPVDSSLFGPERVARLTLREEPEFFTADSGLLGVDWSTLDDPLWKLLAANKLGGVPCFIQYVEYPPEGGPWLPILQMDDDTARANFGMGNAYVFVSVDGREGRLLTQC